MLDLLFVGLLVVAGWEWLKGGSGAADSSLSSLNYVFGPSSDAGTTDSTSDEGNVISNFAKSIFRFESGGDYTSSKAARNNNPGNLRPPNGNPNYWQGQTGVDPNGGYAIFDSLDNGFRALQMQIDLNARRSPNMTLTQFFAKFLGQSPNAPMITKEGNPFTYAATVAGWLGLTKDNTISEAKTA